MTDREKIFDGASDAEYLYCMHCERTYKNGEYRQIMTSEMDDILQMCPYEGCKGDAVINAIDWKDVKEHRVDYPNIPEFDKVYPLN